MNFFLYGSKQNSGALYKVLEQSVSSLTCSFTAETLQGLITPETAFLSPAPAGQIVRFFRGALWVAADSVLRYSEPFSYEHFDLRKAFPLGERITLLEPMLDGMFVGTPTRLVWLSGTSPEELDLGIRLNYGVIEGSASRTTLRVLDQNAGERDIVVFMTRDGPHVGLDTGEVRALTADDYVTGMRTRGATTVRRQDGYTQILMTAAGAATDQNTHSVS